MKKYFVFLGIVMAATLSLTNCTKQQTETPVESESEGIPFEFSTVLTRTTNDGVNTNWAKNDAMNLFHAVAGTTDYKSDGEFTVDDNLEGIFSGTLSETLDESSTYDWYAFYPYKANMKTPANTSAGYVTVGGASQTQKGNNSTAHICGSICPLYGTLKGANASDKPAFQMNQLTSVICVRVTNKLSSDLTVSSVSFTSTEDIVGDYYINIAGSPVLYTGRSGNVYNTATLTVTSGTAIATDECADFYIVVKPHTVAAGSSIKISVNGMEKTVTLSSAKTFEAGKIKIVKINYNPTSAGLSLPLTEDFSDIPAATNETTKIETTGTLFTTYLSSLFTSFENVYQTKTAGIIRVAGASDKGIITTKALNLSKSSRVTINAKDYATSSGKYDSSVIVVTVNGKDYSSSTLTSEYADYTFDIPAASSNEIVTIAGKNKTSERFYIDSIKIEYTE